MVICIIKNNKMLWEKKVPTNILPKMVGHDGDEFIQWDPNLSTWWVRDKPPLIKKSFQNILWVKEETKVG